MFASDTQRYLLLKVKTSKILISDYFYYINMYVIRSISLLVRNCKSFLFSFSKKNLMKIFAYMDLMTYLGKPIKP